MAVAEFEEQLTTKRSRFPTGLIGQFTSTMQDTDLANDQDVSAMHRETTLANLNPAGDSPATSDSQDSGEAHPLAPQAVEGGHHGHEDRPINQLPPPFPVSTAGHGAIGGAKSPSAFTPRRNSSAQEEEEKTPDVGLPPLKESDKPVSQGVEPTTGMYMPDNFPGTPPASTDGEDERRSLASEVSTPSTAGRSRKKRVVRRKRVRLKCTQV